MNDQCFECGAPATCAHHVIPRSRGGTKTVPLCGGCHGLAHGLSRETWSDHRALTAAAMASMKTRGLYTGGAAPYGFRADDEGRLVPDEHEQAIAEAAKALRAAGLSFRAIGAALAERGLLNRAGGAWYPSTVKRMLEAAA